ncbi:hypothetical protein HD553DRAFT_306810 [Filobasidium floriforme]|uniref:uncharacterized protein n=1 Tax=Filobasidium floriforme TaxID=5210 RepID=UPI001E8EDCB8|nr:uncharacterized protein HD553DRAFT_306810 [Filobasidium floriforme]KAH8088618.1 hypothetical protein HD553DRAFT_306810 [Filobasidium floriforme]
MGDPLDISGLSNAIIKPLTYTLVLFPIGTGFTGATPLFLMVGWWRQNGVLATIALVMSWFAAIIVWLAFILAIISFSIAKNRLDDMDGFKGILGSGIWLSLTAAVRSS